MSEIRLQSDIVRKFSELYPKKKGQLVHLSNERTGGVKQAVKAKAIGIVKGAADLIFFSEKFDLAMEIKEYGSRHKREQIEAQIKWAKIWEREGNIWRLVSTVEDAISCVEGKFKGLTIKQVETILNNTNTKTIKF